MKIKPTTMPRRLGALFLCLALCLALCLGMLPTSALAVEPKEAAGVFTVTGGTLGTDYTYTASTEASPNGGDVLTIKSNKELTISTNSESETTSGCRIVIENGVTANITLAGVKIAPANVETGDGPSGIDLGSGATLNLTLSDDSTNEICGGTSSTGLPGPGIHVPENATLTITGNGSLEVNGASCNSSGAVGIGGKRSDSEAGEGCGNVIILGGTIEVHGGTVSASRPPVDIGGGGSDTQKGGDCNTVIILTSVNSGEGLTIGGGKGLSSNNGSDGAGIKPTGDGNYTVYGDLELPCDITIPEGAMVVIPEDASLTVPESTTLTNNGTILVKGGDVEGTVNGNQPTYPSTVTVSFSQDGNSVTSVPYGSTVTITATMEKAETAANALEVDPGMVGFYLGEDIQNGILVGTDEVEIVDGVYTAAVDVTLDDEKGVTEVGTITITADFGGYAPEGDESGDSLAPNTGSAKLTVVESYSIDYEKETITIAEGYSLYAEQTGGNAIFTSTGEDDTTNLTGYIQNTEQKLYLQAPTSGEGEQADRREITIPARPQAPNTSVSIDYSGEKLSFPPGTNISNLEYSTDTTDITNWNDIPSGAALSEMGWTGNQMTVYFRTGATESGFASAATQSPLTIPARPAAPNGLNLMDWTDVSVTYYVGEGVQCRLNNDGDWVTPEQDETDYTFTGLTPQTTYTIYARYPATVSQFASAEASDEITTKSSAADAPEVGAATVTDTTVTLPYNAAWEYQMGDDDWRSIQNPNVFTGLTAATQYTYHVRIAETQTAEASAIATVTVWTAYATPTGVQGGVNQITGVTTALEYSNDGGKTWTACQDTTVTGLAAGEYLVRHKAGENIPASAAVTVTVTQYTPPYIPPKPDGPSTGSSDGWKDIQDEIADAEDGDTITIDMNGETEVPGSIFEEVAGKDVTVEIDMGDVTWTVNGQDVPTGTDLSDLDLGVDMGTSGISVDVINAVTGELGSVQITLAHDGEFGFALTLTAPLGKENAGYWANLYHYDEDAETLHYETSALIDDEGDVALRMTHASQYAIVIDSKSHDLPFTDVVTGSWYESAVRYAYTHGIMEGTSATTFVPGKSLTRAEAVQVLYNLEGKPVVSEGTTFPDLVHEWYKPAIAWAESTGVVDGYEDGTFHPDEPVTREEFAQMLYNYAAYKGYDLTAKGDLSQFSDGGEVQEWALPAMTWANGNQLINGHDDGTLEPGGTTTRAQAASILMRFDQKLVE